MKRCLLNFDKAGAEWVIVAHFSQDPRMLEVLRTGKKPHAVTGNLITGVPYDLIMRERDIIGESTDAGWIEQQRREKLPELFKINTLFMPRIFSIYQCGKKSNHGLNYMMEAREFSYQTEMEERDCKKVVELYRKRAYINVPLWWESIMGILRDSRTIINPFGRKRRFMGELNRETQKQAVAHLPQSTNVDMVNEALKLCYDDDWLMSFVDLLVQAHDSILTQVRINDWKRVAHAALRIKHYLEPVVEYGTIEPFTVGTELKIGPTWGDMKEVKFTNDIDKLAKDLKQTYESLALKKELKKAA